MVTVIHLADGYFPQIIVAWDAFRSLGSLADRDNSRIPANGGHQVINCSTWKL